MPRAVRKSVSRCSSRSSNNRNSCRKRHSPRDNVLSSIREAFRSSMNANRCNSFSRESSSFASKPAPPMMQPNGPLLIQPEIKETKIPKRVELTEAKLVSKKSTGLFEHGIRYIMLPLHLLHLCVWGSPTPSSSAAKETKTSPLNSDENNNKSSSPVENKNSTSSSNSCSKNVSSSGSSSGFSSSTSNSSKSSGFPPVNIAATNFSSTSEEKVSVSSSTPSSSSSSVPRVKSSPSIRRNPVSRRILQDETTDESSDEMVTAEEDLDDSSNEQWSNAMTSPSMNMSIDFESYNNFDKVSCNLNANCGIEEPMDVSMEESSLYLKQTIHKSPSRSVRANIIKTTVERRKDTDSSSSSVQDHRSIYRESSHSSVDREIANIFQRACTSSSSDDEDYDHSNGRRNNPFVNKSSDFGPVRSGSRFKEEICDAAIRKKRTSCQYDRVPEIQAKINIRSGSESRSSEERPIDLSNIKISKENNETQNSQGTNKSISQTDSAYSDEDVEMNSINESIIRLQSVHMQSLHESVVEWMDQDLDYVADTEDSNDDSPFPDRPRISSINTVSLANQGFVKRNNHPQDLGTPLGEWKEISGLEKSILNGQINTTENRTSLRDWRKNFGLEKTMINSQIATKKEITPLKNGEKAAGLDRSIDTQIAGPREADDDMNRSPRSSRVEKLTCDSEVAGRGPPGFPDAPQHPTGTPCHCGNPNCFYVPLAIPTGASAVNWTGNFLGPPAPLKHLYCEYPEFISPPAQASTDDHRSPYVLIPVPANLICQDLA